MKSPRTTTLYLASVPLLGGVIPMVMLSATFVAVDFGAKPWHLGLLGCGMAGTYALFCPIFGRLLGRAHPKAKGIVACAMFVLVSALMAQVSGFWLLFALVIVIGLAGAIYWPTITGVICEGRTRAGVRRSLGTYNVLWCFSNACGTFLAGRLYEVGRAWPFHVGACLAAVALLLLAVMRSPNAHDAASESASGPHDCEDEVPRELATTFFYLSRVINFLAFFTLGSLRYLFPKYGEMAGFSPSTISTLLFVLVMAQGATFVLFRNTGFWHYRFWPLLLTAAGAAVSFFVVASVPNLTVLVVAFLCIGVFLGCSFFSSIYYAMARPAAGVESAAWHETAVGVGLAIGPIAGGLFAQKTGSITAPFLLSGVVAAIGFGITVQFLLRLIRRSGPDPT